jgi:glutamine---fructose-6-phosphate transaminase (isomerizing)
VTQSESPNSAGSHMAREAREAPEAVARFLDRNAAALAELGRRLRAAPPPVVVTSARGSSDHASGFFKYLTEILVGVPCASMGASVVSVYGGKLKAKGALCLTVSQSGKSPDIVALQEAARTAGALTVALVNTGDSPAALNADICLPLHAGEEKSVAATKSFIVSCSAGAAIVAHWLDDAAMLAAVARLPETLARAAALSWPPFGALARDASSLFVLGRGPSFPIAQEVALKLKETCAIHAEAYSVAEVMHGPWELVDQGFPVLALAPDDAARAITVEAVEKLRKAGAQVHVAGGDLAAVSCGDPLLDSVAMVQTAYLEIEKLAQTLGRDPDRPRLLKKVTETI